MVGKEGLLGVEECGDKGLLDLAPESAPALANARLKSTPVIVCGLVIRLLVLLGARDSVVGGAAGTRKVKGISVPSGKRL